jgi:hypothetical protein
MALIDKYAELADKETKPLRIRRYHAIMDNLTPRALKLLRKKNEVDKG